jgi:hypothetical protein
MDATRRTQPRTARAGKPVRAPAALRLTEAMRQRIQQDALAFVAERYRLDDAQRAALAAIPIRWRRGRGGSAYFTRATRGFDGPHILLRVAPGRVARWHTYRRARARFGTPPEGIELHTRILATAVLVHELTHAVQHGACGGPRRRFSEVETTENEIEYVRRHAPDAFANLRPVMRRVRAARAGRLKASAPPRGGLAALRAIVLRTAGAIVGLVSPRTPPQQAPATPTRPRRTRSPRPTGS